MIRLLAIRKNVSLQIREKFSFNPKRLEVASRALNQIFDEVVILNTCNRTEIYFNSFCDISDEEILKKIFDSVDWDYGLKDNCIILNEKKAIRHLMDVACGFHSKIFGEDQILGQIKNAYAKALELNTVKSNLKKLFELTITCGKEFRTESKLYEIPVSSASIAVNEAINKNCKNFMLIGYGDVGKLVTKYILSNKFDSLIIGVRNISKVDDINDSRVEIMNYEYAREKIEDVDCLISCTSAPHLMIEKKHIKSRNNPIMIFDLSLPRDVDEEVKGINGVELYDIDDVSSIDDNNKEKRREIMNSNRHIIDKYMSKYEIWEKQRKISPYILEMKTERDKVILDRVNSFKNKCKDDNDVALADKLIKSVANVYVNRAIELLKEEALKGSEDECLRIIERIFLEKN